MGIFSKMFRGKADGEARPGTEESELQVAPETTETIPTPQLAQEPVETIPEPTSTPPPNVPEVSPPVRLPIPEPKSPPVRAAAETSGPVAPPKAPIAKPPLGSLRPNGESSGLTPPPKLSSLPSSPARPRGDFTPAPIRREPSGLMPVPPLPGGKAAASKVKEPIPPKPDKPVTPVRAPHELAKDIAASTDAAFDAACLDMSAAQEGVLVEDSSTRGEIVQLFAAIAASHAEPIRQLILELSLAETPKSWIDVARPAVAAMQQAARTMKLDELMSELSRFDAVLMRATTVQGAKINGMERSELIERYRNLCHLLPAAFAISTDVDRREMLIVDALLSEVPGMHRPAKEKLYMAGLTKLDKLFHATPEELSQTSGVSLERCRDIVACVQGYRKERNEVMPDLSGSLLRTRVSSQLEQLRHQQSAFVEAERAENATMKRNARRERSVVVRRLSLLMAQLGETAVADELERLPVERKIERVAEYLRQTGAALARA